MSSRRPIKTVWIWSTLAIFCFFANFAYAKCRTSSAARLVELATPGDLSKVKRLGIKGTTTIVATVGLSSGSTYLARARFAKSSGSSSLDWAAMYAVRYSTFAPGTCDGVPVGGDVVVKVTLP